MQQDAANGAPPSANLAALLSALFHDAEDLLLQQLALARAELGENIGQFVGGAVVLLAGLGVALVGGLALAAALVLLLAYLMPLWAAAALVGAALAAGGAGAVLYGRRLMARATLVPHGALRSMRETGEWLREELT